MIRYGSLPIVRRLDPRGDQSSRLETDEPLGGGNANLFVHLAASDIPIAAGGAQIQIRDATDTGWVNVGVAAEGATILHLPIRIQGTGGLVVEPAGDNSANGAGKLPVLPARATALAPLWTEGNQVPLSTDLAGNLRTSGGGGGGGGIVQQGARDVSAQTWLVDPLPSERVVTGTIAALNDIVAIDVRGKQSALCVVTGTFVGSMWFEASEDGGTTYSDQKFIFVALTLGDPDWRGPIVTGVGVYAVPIHAGVTHLRLGAFQAWTSGTATVTWRAGGTNFNFPRFSAAFGAGIVPPEAALVAGLNTAGTQLANLQVVTATPVAGANALVVRTAQWSSQADNTGSSSTKMPVLPATAGTVAPSWTNTFAVPLSVSDATGALRTQGVYNDNAPNPANAKLPVLAATVVAVGGVASLTASNIAPLTVDTTGRLLISSLSATDPAVSYNEQSQALRVGAVLIGTDSTKAANNQARPLMGVDNNSSAAFGSKLVVLPAFSASADPSWTDSRIVPISVDLAGNTRARINSWFGSSAPTVGSKVSASSLPVVIASDQGALPVKGADSDNAANSTTKLPVIAARANAAEPTWTEGNEVPLSTDLAGRARVKLADWLGSTAPTVGQKIMASSLPVTLASDQSALPVSQSGTWTVQQGTPPWTDDLTRVGGVALTGDNSANFVAKVPTLPLRANAAFPAWTEGNMAPLSGDLSGRLRVVGYLDHDAVNDLQTVQFAGNARAVDDPPTAVSAAGDRARAWLDRFGAVVVRRRKIRESYTAVYRLAEAAARLDQTFTHVANTNKQWATLHHTAAATKEIRLQQVKVYIVAWSVASQGILELRELSSTTAPATGNPAITPRAHRIGTGAAEAIALYLPTTQGSEAAANSPLGHSVIDTGIEAAGSTVNPFPQIVPIVLYDASAEDDEVLPPTAPVGVYGGWAVMLRTVGTPAVRLTVVYKFTEEIP